MPYKISLLPGDGIGQEIMLQAKKVLEAVQKKYSSRFTFLEGLIGGAAIDKAGEPLPRDTLDQCRQSDAVLMGAVGGPKWDDLPPNQRPEKGLLAIRKELRLFANLRPSIIYEELKDASCLRPDIVGAGVDVMVVRELTGGIYFGEPRGREVNNGQRSAYNTMRYSEEEIRRIAEVAFEIARKRRFKLCSVDKANVLDVSGLWREVVSEVSAEYADVELSHMYVDNAAMQLVRNPSQFDVIVTSNLFGDILSDEAAVITGSIGLLPSASLGRNNPGLYEPVHGSAPDIMGEDKANPLAIILSAAMMLRYSFNLEHEAMSVERAVKLVLSEGYRTVDIEQPRTKVIGCSRMGDLVAQRIEE